MPLSGVTYAPLFEWLEAAHWARIDWETFRHMDGHDQARIVAHYRAHQRLEAVIAQDTQRKYAHHG